MEFYVVGDRRYTVLGGDEGGGKMTFYFKMGWSDILYWQALESHASESRQVVVRIKSG